MIIIVAIGIISGVIALLVTCISFLIKYNSLNSKSELSQAFFTDELKLKVYYYRLSMLSFIIFIEAFCIIMLFSGIENEVIDFNYVVAVFILSLLIALVSFLLVGKIIKVVQNFRIKSHYKFQIVLPEVDSDNLYIIRMYNKDICICSKDPNSEINEESEKTYLIPLEDIMKKELTKTTWPLPEMNLLQKIFN